MRVVKTSALCLACVEGRLGRCPKSDPDHLRFADYMRSVLDLECPGPSRERFARPWRSDFPGPFVRKTPHLTWVSGIPYSVALARHTRSQQWSVGLHCLSRL